MSAFLMAKYLFLCFYLNMKITPIKSIIFTGSEKIKTGYDDAISQSKRDFIREHLMSEAMPKPETYSGRLSEFEMNKLLNSLLKYNEPKYIDDEIMCKLPMRNIQKLIGLNAYRGAAPVNCSDLVYEEMERAGIKRIVNLTGYNLNERVKQYSIECFNFDMNNIYGAKTSDMFFNDEDIVKKVQHNMRGCDNELVNEYIRYGLETHKQNLEVELDRFVKFIQILQKDYYYIGCEFGTYATDNALLLNRFFNPKKTAPIKSIRCNAEYFVKNYFIKLYNNLQPYHKKAMGWTNSFNEDLGNRLIALAKAHH